MVNPIYLDYAATTPVAPEVIELMTQYLGVDGNFANPASRSHVLGWQAEAAVESARKQVAEAISADTREVVWTSGATEANNLAIKGAAEHYRERHSEGGHIITSATEHKAVLDCVAYLEQQGFRATYIKPGPGGVVTKGLVESHLEDDTFLVSIMHVNNETGVVNDIQDISTLLKSRDILLHVDAAQSLGKLSIDTRVIQADMISMCAHKLYGPKGIGALYVRRQADFAPMALIHGGGHERGMRSGTLAVHQIVAMGKSVELAVANMDSDMKHASVLKELFVEGLEGVPEIALNGNQKASMPNIANICFGGRDGQLLLSALPGLAISSGSACTSASMSPSHVLQAMGVDEVNSLSSLRISFGRYTSADEVKTASQMVRDVALKLKAS